MASHARSSTAMPPPPLLLITDHTTSPPTSTRYIRGNNDIAFPTAYTQIKSLLTHPACPRPGNPPTWPCPPCESTFTTHYWSCAATLLDYFADFYPTDTPLMQSIWFYLLDIWQECALHLPYESVLENREAAGRVADRARAFEKSVRDTISLLQVAIWGRGVSTGDEVIYDPRGEAWCPLGEYETGPWVSGVKPWGQFLGAGGVGVAPPFGGRVHVAAAGEEEKKGGGDGDGDEKKGSACVLEAERRKTPTTTSSSSTTTTTRYIPHPALGLINSHTERAHTLASLLFAKQDPELLTASLADFDAHCLRLPASRNESQSYTSRITGLETRYTLANGAPPVVRYAGLGDPQMVLRGKPDWNLLDECVASCRGVGAYVPVSGGGGGGDGGGDRDEDMEDGEEEDGEDVFDMWTVVEKRTVGDKGKVLDLGDLFETWCGVDEF